jgi:hypothetical protein
VKGAKIIKDDAPSTLAVEEVKQADSTGSQKSKKKSLDELLESGMV